MEVRVRDLMQADVVTLEASATVDLADDLMRQVRIRHLPVLSRGTLVGIVSQRDLFRAAVSSVLHLQPGAEKDWLSKIRIADVMSPDVFTTQPDASLVSAVEMMVLQRVGCLPVVKDGKLVGLLSESDCMRHFARLLRAP